MAQTIAMFNLNDTRRDPRVRRIGLSLAKAGHRVVVFEMRGTHDRERDIVDGIEIRRVAVPMRYEAEDMAEFRKICRPAFEIIGCCDPHVAGGRSDRCRNGAGGWPAIRDYLRHGYSGRGYLRRKSGRPEPSPDPEAGKSPRSARSC